MDEVIYMVGSAAAVTLLVAHVARFLFVRLRSTSRREHADLRVFEAACMELRDELHQLREDQALAVEELTERVEFAERLLARASQQPDEARIATPV